MHPEPQIMNLYVSQDWVVSLTTYEKAAILKIKVKSISEHFKKYSDDTGMLEIVRKDYLFVIIV